MDAIDWLDRDTWAFVGVFCGAWIGIFTLVSLLAARIPKFGDWMGKWWQNFTGVTALRDDLKGYTRDAQTRYEGLDRRVAATENIQASNSDAIEKLTKLQHETHQMVTATSNQVHDLVQRLDEKSKQ